MARTDEPTVTRVVSRDVTEIAYWTNGEGPALVVVHGTPADHTRWRPVAALPGAACNRPRHGQARSWR